MRRATIDLRWTSVIVSVDGEVTTKVVLPDNAEITVTVQPSLLSVLTQQPSRVLTIADVVKEYVELVKTGGTYEDLKSYFGNGEQLDSVVEQLRALYFANFGLVLPKLKSRRNTKPVIVDTADMVSAVVELRKLIQ